MHDLIFSLFMHSWFNFISLCIDVIISRYLFVELWMNLFYLHIHLFMHLFVHLFMHICFF